MEFLMTVPILLRQQTSILKSTVSPLSQYLSSGQVSMPSKSFPKARLLTSEMCLAQLKKKEEDKRKAAEEKERRKLEREEKWKERLQKFEEKKKQRKKNLKKKAVEKQTRKLKEAWAIIVVESVLQLLMKRLFQNNLHCQFNYYKKKVQIRVWNKALQVK